MPQFLSRLRLWWDHRWARGLMSAYLDGELTARRRGRMERHVGECHECRRLVRALRLVIDALHRLPASGGGGDASQIAAAVRVRLSEPPGS